MEHTQVSERDVEKRARDIIQAQARKELEAEAREAARIQHEQDMAAKAYYDRTVATARAGIAGLQEKYAERAALALELAPKVIEFIQLTNALSTQIDAISAPALEARQYLKDVSERDVCNAIGGAPIDVHLRIGIHPVDDVSQWAALLASVLIRGTLRIGDVDGTRGGYVVVGDRTSIMKFT